MKIELMHYQYSIICSSLADSLICLEDELEEVNKWEDKGCDEVQDCRNRHVAELQKGIADIKLILEYLKAAEKSAYRENINLPSSAQE
jgi:hypothetical protein